MCQMAILSFSTILCMCADARRATQERQKKMMRHTDAEKHCPACFRVSNREQRLVTCEHEGRMQVFYGSNYECLCEMHVPDEKMRRERWLAYKSLERQHFRDMRTRWINQLIRHGVEKGDVIPPLRFWTKLQVKRIILREGDQTLVAHVLGTPEEESGLDILEWSMVYDCVATRETQNHPRVVAELDRRFPILSRTSVHINPITSKASVVLVLGSSQCGWKVRFHPMSSSTSSPAPQPPMKPASQMKRSATSFDLGNEL